MKSSAAFEEKKPEFESKMGNAACFVKKSRAVTKEEIKKAVENGAFEENVPKTKTSFVGSWGPDFSETEKMKEWLAECQKVDGDKSDESKWVQLPGKHA